MLVRKICLFFSFFVSTIYAEDIFTEIFIQNYIKGNIQRILKKIDQNNQCMKDILHVTTGITNKELWALRMIDSSSKLNPGLTNGNLLHYGSFDSCLAIDHTISNSSKVKGKYCLYIIGIRAILNNKIKDFELYRYFEELTIGDLSSQYIYLKDDVLSFFGALCVPDSCTAQDLYMLQDALDIDNYLLNITITLNDSYCQTRDDFNYNKWETSAWLGIAFFVFIGLLMFTNTIYHAYLILFNKKPIYRIFLAFSIYGNFMKIISTRNDPEMIPCINGLRTISMMWIILGHRYFITVIASSVNTIFVMQEWIKGPVASIVFASTLAVDTFFVISGILVIYIVLTATSKGIKFTLLHYYLHRYIRLTPAIGAVIIAYVTFYKHLSYGPMLPVSLNVIKPCYKNWWKTLLYIQNNFEVKDICIGQSWYLAIDTQLYVLAPIIFLSLQKWPVVTLFGMCILILISSYAGFYKSWIYHISANPILTFANFNTLYASTLVRMSSWLIGGITGYVLFKTHRKEIHIKSSQVFFIWVIVLLAMTYNVLQIMFFTNYNLNQIYSSLYYASSRVFWSTSLGWIVWACAHGYGGMVNKFLSCKIFTILGRLTYSMYLLQIGMYYLFFSRRQTPEYFSDFFMAHSFWGDFVFITAAALLWCLAFESPVIAIGKLFIPKGKPKPTQNQEENNELSRL